VHTVTCGCLAGVAGADDNEHDTAEPPSAAKGSYHGGSLCIALATSIGGMLSSRCLHYEARTSVSLLPK
jgi:hypothetical protein